ncbi:MAG: hypothetical protein ACK500_09945 [Flavobacteriales bacterium]
MKFICSLALMCICHQLAAQVLGTPLANWDFVNGIPANWENGSTSGIGIWEYRGPDTTPSNAVCSRGSCGAGTVPPASGTLANGFVIFDSNYWDDNDAQCGGLGTGQDPSPHTAWLITNPINLSGATGAVITFQQQVRLFQATTKVQVSINGGALWTDIITNTVNVSPNVEWKSGNISAIAAGQSNVQFRFLFTGTYYHWCIDDITVYQPNQNDLQLSSPAYTLFGNSELPAAISDMPYDQYPQFMVTPFNFKSVVTNIGSQPASDVTMNVKVLNSLNSTLYDQTSTPTPTLAGGASTTLQIANPYNPPTALGDYRIAYNASMTQSDQNIPNNRDTLDFTITTNTYARDEGPMQNVFVPQLAFQNQRQHIGNFFEIKTAGYQLNSISAAVGTGTAPGTVVKGYVYNYELNTILAESDPFTINLADINTTGEEKIIVLPFSSPFPVIADSNYCVMIGNVDPSQTLRVCRSGASPENTSFVRYPDSFGLFYLLTTPVVRMNLFPLGVTSGCTDSEAANYDPTATVDDGSCLYPGCTIPGADNYDPNANFDDGSCILAGCTDPDADNYNPNATSDNGSCIYLGCTDENADNYDPQATEDNGSCLYSGCTDPAADNYDPDANAEDGSCIYSGCTDPLAANYDVNANQDDGSCIYPGCTDPEADNYDPNANQENGSCAYTIAAIFTFDTEGCAPHIVNVINQTQIVDGSFCTFSISDGTELGGCVESFQHTFTEPGEYFITMTYVTPTGESQDVIGPIIVSGYPDVPVIEESGDALVCLNCGSEDATWSYNGQATGQTESTQPILVDGIYQNGYYTLTTTNEAGCSSVSEEVLVLHAQFDVTPETGCIPFDITLEDLTLLLPDMTCTFAVGESIFPSSVNPIDVTIEEAGLLEIVLNCTLGDLTVSAQTSIQAFHGITPDLVFDEVNGQLNCTNCGGENTTWSIDGAQVATNVSSLFVTEGLVEVELIAEGGCESLSSILLITVEEARLSAVKVYPNPSDEGCMVESSLPVLRCEVIDPAGKVIEVHSPVRNAFMLNTGRLASGLYTLRLHRSDGQVMRRISVQH